MNQQQQSSIERMGQARDQTAVTEEFFEQMQPAIKKGRAWTFDRLGATCDTPGTKRVQAVLYPNDGLGFALYARQGRTLHAVTYEGRPVCFRTIEKALTTLADVTHLDPEIVVDSSNWHEESGPI